MPRLTNPNYLRTYLWLAGVLSSDPTALAKLSPSDQSFIHDYFRPTENVTAADMLTHRREITRLHPSLPHNAGRALSRFKKLQAAPAHVPVTAGSSTGARRVVVHGTIRPEVDTDRMVKALLRAMEDIKLDPPA